MQGNLIDRQTATNRQSMENVVKRWWWQGEKNSVREIKSTVSELLSKVEFYIDSELFVGGVIVDRNNEST